MRGGPILDKQGRLIGVNGKADGKIDYRLNIIQFFGIPINTYCLVSRTPCVVAVEKNKIKPKPRNHGSKTGSSTSHSITRLITSKANFSYLNKVLAAGKWNEADKETSLIIEKIIDRYSVPDSVPGKSYDYQNKNFPLEELRILDQLWVKYSGGRFGLSVQKQAWIDSGGTPGVYDVHDFWKFKDTVGWGPKEDLNLGNTIVVTKVTEVPKGYLPKGYAHYLGGSGVDKITFFFGLNYSR
jgi:hypothetical protein